MRATQCRPTLCSSLREWGRKLRRQTKLGSLHNANFVMEHECLLASNDFIRTFLHSRSLHSKVQRDHKET